jgi:hypothetical protein
MLVNHFDFDTNQRAAHIRAVDMVKNQLYSRFGLPEEARIEKAELGCLGEFAFEHFLRANHHHFQVDRRNFTNRNTDEYDFLINGKKIDIKVAKKSTPGKPDDRWTYGYPAEQRPVQKDFVVIGWVDFSKKEVGFYGWTTGLAITRFPIVTKNSFKGYNYFTPNHEFQWGVLEKNFDNLFDNLS